MWFSTTLFILYSLMFVADAFKSAEVSGMPNRRLFRPSLSRRVGEVSLHGVVADHSDVSQGLKIIIAGAPAAGKGTQCEVIKSKYGVVHLSTGDILRAAVAAGTDLGLKAKAFMDGGQLVPDELIINVVCERLRQGDCQTKGWLLDGFPRTKQQADALNAAGFVPDCFLLLDVPEEVLVERVTGRRTDPVTNTIYHMKFNPPPAEIVGRLLQRSDDTKEKIVVRYREFQSHINSVKSSYADKLVTIDGSDKPAAISGKITAHLDQLQQAGRGK